jgi:phosphatidate cytidylyltransferase
MKRVATAAVLIPLVLLLVFKAPPWLMALVLALIAWLCLREYFAIVEAHGIKPFRGLTTLVVLAALLVPIASITYRDAPTDVIGVGVIALFLLFSPLLLLGRGMGSHPLRELLPAASISTFGVLYIGLSLLTLWLLWVRLHGASLVFYLLIVVWAGDIFAYYVGRAIGGRKLAPSISPGKTWAGALGSFVGSVVLGTLILWQLWPVYQGLTVIRLVEPVGFGQPVAASPPLYPFWFALVATAVINLAAQIGDLVESAIKRGAGLKDSGSLLPGHGGILDRVDALLAASPVAWLLFNVLGVRFGSGFLS